MVTQDNVDFIYRQYKINCVPNLHYTTLIMTKNVHSLLLNYKLC